MSALKAADLQHLQAQLRERELALREQVRAVRAEHAESPELKTSDEVEDFGEQGEERMRGAVRHAEEERDIEELREIDDALTRMEAGHYGDCSDCGKHIPLARLQAQPTAKRCVACQEKFEKTHPGPRYSPGM